MMFLDAIGSSTSQRTEMATYQHQDLESLIDDLSRIFEADVDDVEKQELLRQLYLKKSKSEIDKIYSIAELFIYNYDRVFFGGSL